MSNNYPLSFLVFKVIAMHRSFFTAPYSIVFLVYRYNNTRFLISYGYKGLCGLGSIPLPSFPYSGKTFAVLLWVVCDSITWIYLRNHVQVVKFIFCSKLFLSFMYVYVYCLHSDMHIYCLHSWMHIYCLPLTERSHIPLRFITISWIYVSVYGHAHTVSFQWSPSATAVTMFSETWVGSGSYFSFLLLKIVCIMIRTLRYSFHYHICCLITSWLILPTHAIHSTLTDINGLFNQCTIRLIVIIIFRGLHTQPLV